MYDTTGAGQTKTRTTASELADLVWSLLVEPDPTFASCSPGSRFNIIMGNTDDHARNHAAFWDGAELALTPAYDIVPQLRHGEEASQAMAIDPDGFRGSQLAGCVERAASYRLSDTEARAIIDQQIATVEERPAIAPDSPPRTARRSGAVRSSTVRPARDLTGRRPPPPPPTSSCTSPSP